MGSSLPAPPMPFGLPPPPGMPGFNPLDPMGKQARGASPSAAAAPVAAAPGGGASKKESPGASGIRAKRVRKGFSYGSLPGNGGAGRGAFGTLLGGGMPGGRTLLGG